MPAGLDISQPGRFHDAFGEEEVLAASVFRRDDGGWTAEYLFETRPDAAALNDNLAPIFAEENIPAPTPRIEEVNAEQDWLEICYRALPAFTVGKFYIYGSHCEGGVPDGQIGLLIDAVQAFGSGSHGTTKGCVELLQGLALDKQFNPRSILDLGTGSGILAIAAAYLWAGFPIIASDIEEESADATRRHAAMNNMEDRVVSLHATGFDHPQIQGGAPYDLIIANILPGVVMDLSDGMMDHATPDAFILLSGIRDEVAPSVCDHFAAKDCGEIARVSHEGWTSLLLRRGG